MPSLEYKLHIFMVYQIFHCISATLGQAPVTPMILYHCPTAVLQGGGGGEGPPPQF